MREINLLPPHRRHSLRVESLLVAVNSFLRSIVFGLLLISVAGGVAIGGLWGASFAAGQDSEKDLSETVTQYRTLRDTIAKRNVILEQIATIGEDRVVWSEVFRSFFTVVPPGVTVGSLQASSELVNGVTEAAKFSVSGRAITRSTLTVFQERLQGLSEVKKIDSPTSNLLDRNNPQYTFTVHIRERVEARPKK